MNAQSVQQRLDEIQRFNELAARRSALVYRGADREDIATVDDEIRLFLSRCEMERGRNYEPLSVGHAGARSG